MLSGVQEVKKRVNKPACAIKKLARACVGQLSMHLVHVVNGPSRVPIKAGKKL